MFVCDNGNDRVQIFRKSNGLYVRELRHAASDGLEAAKPYFISIEDDELFVADGTDGKYPSDHFFQNLL